MLHLIRKIKQERAFGGDEVRASKNNGPTSEDAANLTIENDENLASTDLHKSVCVM